MYDIYLQISTSISQVRFTQRFRSCNKKIKTVAQKFVYALVAPYIKTLRKAQSTVETNVKVCIFFRLQHKAAMCCRDCSSRDIKKETQGTIPLKI